MRGCVAIVTGCGQADGIGAAIARALSIERASLVLTGTLRPQGPVDQLEEIARTLAKSGEPALPFRGNVAEEADCRSIVEFAIDKFGRIDVLVNNAGANHGADNAPATEVTRDEWQRVLDVNLTGAFLLARHAARVMVKQNCGRIVNVSSLAAVRGAQDRAAYSASKAGLLGVTLSLAAELAPFGITVNAVLPGKIVTRRARPPAKESGPDAFAAWLAPQVRRIPMGRLGTADDVAMAVAFLASPQAAYITGQMLAVDGGMGTLLG